MFTKYSFTDSQHYPECVCKLLLSCEFFVSTPPVLPGGLPVIVLSYLNFYYQYNIVVFIMNTDTPKMVFVCLGKAFFSAHYAECLHLATAELCSVSGCLHRKCYRSSTSARSMVKIPLIANLGDVPESSDLGSLAQ